MDFYAKVFQGAPGEEGQNEKLWSDKKKRGLYSGSSYSSSNKSNTHPKNGKSKAKDKGGKDQPKKFIKKSFRKKGPRNEKNGKNEQREKKLE